jgi:hypothetical protein
LSESARDLLYEEEDFGESQPFTRGNLDRFLRSVRSFPKTTEEIRNFTLAKITREENDDIVIVVSLRAARQRDAWGHLHEVQSPHLLSQSIHSGSHWISTPTSLSKMPWQFLSVPSVGATTLEIEEPIDEKLNDPKLNEEESEFSVASAALMLISDTAKTVRDQNPWSLLTWGTALTGLSYAFGGLTGQLGAAVALAAGFSILKMIEDLKAGRFAPAAWRIAQFPLWMVFISLGAIADKGFFPDTVAHYSPFRELMLVFVMGACFLGSVYAALRLVGLGDRVAIFLVKLKRLIKEELLTENEPAG